MKIPPRATSLTLLALAVATAQAARPSVEEILRKNVGKRYWYGLYLQGQKAGYAMTEAVEGRFADQPAVVFRMLAHMKITALGQRQEVEVDQRRTYLRTGPLRKVTSRFKTAASDVQVTGVVRGDKLLVTSRMGALKSEKEFPAPKETLEDFVAASMLVTADAKIGDEVRIHQFDPTVLKDLEAIITLVERKTITFNGVRTPVFVLENRIPALNVQTTMIVDSEGVPLEATLENLFVMRLEPEAQAKDIRYSSDLVRMGCVRLDPHPKNIAALRSARFSFQGIPDRNLLINDRRQKWTRLDDTTYLVTTRLMGVEKSARLPVDRERFADFLKPTLFVHSDDPRIKALAAKIVGGERDAYPAARKIRSWVYKNLRKVGTAALSNAVETLQARSGDCTEHTVLFVALARAAGIPAREVAGITCIEGGKGFYFHAWPEVWAGEWVAMDPTLGQDVADPTHIKFAEGGGEQLFKIVGLFGRMKAKYLPEHAP